MATYKELFGLKSDSAFRNKVSVAVIVKAQALIDGATPTSDEITWANNAISTPNQQADKIVNYVLAVNKSATTVQITGASDSAIQSNVDAAVDSLISGGAVI